MSRVEKQVKENKWVNERKREEGAVSSYSLTLKYEWTQVFLSDTIDARFIVFVDLSVELDCFAVCDCTRLPLSFAVWPPRAVCEPCLVLFKLFFLSFGFVAAPPPPPAWLFPSTPIIWSNKRLFELFDDGVRYDFVCWNSTVSNSFSTLRRHDTELQSDSSLFASELYDSLVSNWIVGRESFFIGL